MQPPERIVAQLRPVRRRHQPVLDVVDVAPRAVGGEVAVGVIAERCRPGGDILVQPVGRVGPLHGIMAGPGIGVIVAADAGDLAGGIVRIGPGHVGRAAAAVT